MFSNCNLTWIASGFLNPGSTINKTLTHMSCMFYSNDNLEGPAPAFYDKAKFTAIEESKQGYHGAFYQCPNIDNLHLFNNASPNWTIAVN